mmetsp:Transcript_103982/g.299309  ORF Transcript_103982/g.299309 Transcript_103982/m.299309 type:complete len:270 (-) Transcript_103982:298-1107(-)
MLEELEFLRRIRARPGEENVVAAWVAAEQGLEVVDAVVQDHVGLRARRVLRDLRAGEEWELAPACDALELREARLLGAGAALRGLRRGAGCLHCLDVLVGGSLEAPQLRPQLLQQRRVRVFLRLGTDLAHARLGAHIELHPRAAREPPRDLVPHHRGIPAPPSEDGVPLLRVVLQEVREVVDHPVQGHPQVMGFVVPGHLGERNAAAGALQLREVDLRLRQQRVELRLDGLRLGVVLRVQRHPLLGLQLLQLRLQVRVDALVLQQVQEA